MLVAALYFFCIDGQAIAKKICGQITKTTNTIKKMIKQYGKKIADHASSKYPPDISFDDVTNLNSTIWNHLEENVDVNSHEVPYYIRRKIVDYRCLIQRCTEEIEYIKKEMTTVVEYYSSSVALLDALSEELKSKPNCPESRGLCALAMTRKEVHSVIVKHLNCLFASHLNTSEVVAPSEEGVFTTCVTELESDEMEVDDNEDSQELGDASMLDALISVLNSEFGEDDGSDDETSDDDL